MGCALSVGVNIQRGIMVPIIWCLCTNKIETLSLSAILWPISIYMSNLKQSNKVFFSHEKNNKSVGVRLKFLSSNTKYEKNQFVHIWGVLGEPYVEPRVTKFPGQ